MGYIGMNEAARRLGVSRTSIRSRMLSGSLSGIVYDIGGGKSGYIVSAESLAAVAAERAAKAAEAAERAAV